MSWWWLWLIVAVVLGIIEIATFTFVLLWIAIGGLITAVLAPMIPNVWVQLLLFAVVSLVLYWATRPLARKWKQQRTYLNPVESLVGKKAHVVTAANPGSLATVRVGGEVWSATSDEPLAAGAAVLILEANSTVLHVAPVPDDAIAKKEMGE